MTTRRRITLLMALLLMSVTPDVLQAQQWTKLNTPIDTTIVGFLENDGVILIGTLGRGIYRTSDAGTTWLHVLDVPAADPRKESIFSIIRYGGYLHACGQRRGAYRSSDNGVTWGFSDTLPGFISMSVVDSTMYAGTDGRRLFRSTDSGSTWRVAPDARGLASQFLTVYHYKGYYFGGCGNGLFRTGDTGGFSWVRKTMGNSTAVNWVGELSGTLYASTNDGMWKWDEAKDTMVRSGMNGRFIIDVELIGDTMYASTYYDGVFVTRDRGATWDTFNDGLIDTTVSELGSIHGDLYAGVMGHGLWVYRSSQTVGVDELDEHSALPISDRLRIHHDPVAGHAVLEVALWHPSSVSIMLYDGLGRFISQPVVNRFFESGEHRIVLGTKRLAGGVYLCKVQAEGVVRTVRFVVAR